MIQMGDRKKSANNTEPKQAKQSIESRMSKVKIYTPRVFVSFLLMFWTSFSYAADPNKGAQVYATHCITCHGPSGTGVMPNAPNFTKSEGLLSSDRDLLSSIKSGKAAMPSYRGVLSDQDILNVIAYLRTFN